MKFGDPINSLLGREVYEVSSVVCEADTAGSRDAKKTSWGQDNCQ